MPVNCTKCGVPLEPGSRFCVNCGAPVPRQPGNAPGANQSGQSYPGAEPRQTEARQSAAVPRPQTKQAREVSAEREQSDRGLNIALIICGVLAVGVLVFLIIMLLQSNKDPSADRPTAETTQVVPSGQPTAGPVDTDPGQPTGFPVPSASPDPGPVVIPSQATAVPSVTPASPSPVPILPSSVPVITTPAPLPATPTPLPATPTPSPGGASATTVPLPSPSPSADYLLPDSATRYLTEADISGLSHEQLCFARNEIFARHGRIFKTPQLAAYFNSKSWYHGTISPDKFDESVLNSYEWANINLIRNYENKHYGGSYY